MNGPIPSRGVTSYATLVAIVPIHFPDGKIVCSGCRFCRSDEALKRYRCLLTDDILYHPITEIGDHCPIPDAFEKEGEE